MRRNDRPQRTPLTSELSAEQTSRAPASRCARRRGRLVEERRRRHFGRHRPCRKAGPAGDGWLLTGDKYFTSNAGAELAVVAARPEGAAAGVRGLALFLVPRCRNDGELNYFIRRLKDKIATRSVPTGEVELRDSEGYLLGSAGSGIYLILEVFNLLRPADSVVRVALAQRAVAAAL